VDLKSKGFASDIGCEGDFSSLIHCWLNIECSRGGEWWCERGRSTERDWDWLQGERAQDWDFWSGRASMGRGGRFIRHVEQKGQHLLREVRERAATFILSRGCF
jgi:hypothetical protein